MSPQRSNRVALIEGTLRCLERLPPERVTAREIAAEAGANLASIGYHFGSKDALVTEAVVAGLDRWLAAIADGLEHREAGGERGLDAVLAAYEASRPASTGVARAFVSAITRAPYDEAIRSKLVEGFRRARGDVDAVLGAGEAGEPGAGALALAMFHGLLLAELLDDGLRLEGERLRMGLDSLARVLGDQEA
jgi:AcrR family transcriptional regulator